MNPCHGSIANNAQPPHLVCREFAFIFAKAKNASPSLLLLLRRRCRRRRRLVLLLHISCMSQCSPYVSPPLGMPWQALPSHRFSHLRQAGFPAPLLSYLPFLAWPRLAPLPASPFSSPPCIYLGCFPDHAWSLLRCARPSPLAPHLDTELRTRCEKQGNSILTRSWSFEDSSPALPPPQQRGLCGELRAPASCRYLLIFAILASSCRFWSTSTIMRTA